MLTERRQAAVRHLLTSHLTNGPVIGFVITSPDSTAGQPSIFRRNWPVFSALVCFGLTLAATEAAIWPRTGGLLIYPLDDTYIQMAIAKNLARDGTWGVSHQFANAGSSLLWPALLAASYALTGVNEWAPLALNIAAGVLLLVIAARVLAQHLPEPAVAAWLALLVFGIPLYHVARIGMEHTVACLVVIWTVATVAQTLQSGRPPSWPVLCSGALLTTVRFDLAAVVVPLAGALAAYSGWRAAVGFAGLAAGPILAAAVYSWQQGWPLLPTPILLKHRMAGFAPTFEGVLSVVGGGFALLLKTPSLLVIVLVCLVLLVTRRHNDRGSRGAAIMQAVVVAAILIHVNFGQTGWMFRYEAHLIGAGLIAIAVDLRRATRWVGPANRLAAVMLLAVLASPFAIRAGQAFVEITHETYARRYDFLTTEFFAQHPWTGGLVTGHVGVIGFRTDLPIIDSMGLLTPELLAPGRAPDPAIVDRLARARGVKVSFAPAAGWHCVGEWVLDGLPEHLYAVDAETAKRLAADAMAFSVMHDLTLTLGAAGCATSATP